MELWRKVWRQGLVPQLSTPGLERLRMGLLRDDPRLVQGVTCCPPALDVFRDEAVEAACGLGYCFWQGDGCDRVGQIEEAFARVCYEADERLGEPGVCRHFLDWFDHLPRGRMRRQLLGEVQRALADRDRLAA